MSGKGVGHKRDAFRAKERSMKIKISDILTKDIDTIPSQINTQEQICIKCSFKAKYKFIRCPECEALQI